MLVDLFFMKRACFEIKILVFYEDMNGKLPPNCAYFLKNPSLNKNAACPGPPWLRSAQGSLALQLVLYEILHEVVRQSIKPGLG